MVPEQRGRDLADVLNEATYDLRPVMLPVRGAGEGVVVDATPVVDAVNENMSRVVATFMYHEGPLPAPGMLQAYDDAVPGAADRIIAMAENEQRQRHAMQTRSVDGTLQATKRGQVFGLVAALAFAALAGGVALVGYPTQGAVLGTFDVTAVVAVFVLGQYGKEDPSRRRRRREGEVDDEEDTDASL